jgi:DNA (cytosine-5)-methyltransferase 1
MIHTIGKSYFAGGGGLDGSLTESGCDIIQSLEFDKHCCATLKANFTHKVVMQDIRTATVLNQPRTDFIAITYPCNKYSTISDIHGGRTGDELFLHAFRHVALELPEVFMLENVPGMLKFQVVMECFAKIPNYYVNVFCPVDAANWLPQKRERLIIIATKKPFHISDPRKPVRRTRLKDIIEKNVRMDIPDYVYSRLKGAYRDRPIISDPKHADELAPTCVAHYAKDLSTRMVKDKSFKLGVRPYTVREYARLQGFPDWFQFEGGERQAYKQIGNAVAWPVGMWAGKQIVKYFNRKS